MRKEPLAIILTSDLTGKARGRAFRQHDFAKYLRTGCGWVPANFAINAFGEITSPNPFGSVGDLRLMPDASSISHVGLKEASESITMVMANIHNPDGSPWECDPRTFLKNAVADLKDEFGLSVVSSFEHEFMLKGQPDSPVNTPFSLQSFLEEEDFGSKLVAAVSDAGLAPEMWLPEFGKDQFEITLEPSSPIVAADRAIYLREIVRHVAATVGKEITFSPLAEPGGGGNGVHVHLSLKESDERCVTYDPTKTGNISDVAGSFAAGILKYANQFQALTASSPISYDRLQPDRWSTGGVFLGENNREALLRISPLFSVPGANFSRQYNLEYRAADATANPWLTLGAIIRAGIEGLRENLPTPEVVQGDIGQMDSEWKQARALPVSLEDAVDRFENSEIIKKWFPQDFIDTFIAVKRGEIEKSREMSVEELYDSFTTTY